jgi:hypothetical protein
LKPVELRSTMASRKPVIASTLTRTTKFYPDR